MLLKDKVAIITGGASGIGRGIAVKFAEEGGAVAVADITEPEGKKTAAEAPQKGTNGIFVLCDVTSSRQVQEMVSQVIRKYGRIDILVNNARGHRREPRRGLSPISRKSNGIKSSTLI